MRSNFREIMPFVFREEGGYVNNPKDPGGATNMGITIGTLSAWAGHPVTPLDVKNMSQDTAMEIYRKLFWDKIDGDALPYGIDYAVLDFAVNSGPAHAIKMLQKVLGVPEDGVMGPTTIAATAAHSWHDTINALCDARAAWLQGLAAAATFGKGWLARVERVRARALTLAMKPSGEADAAAYTHEEPPVHPAAPVPPVVPVSLVNPASSAPAPAQPGSPISPGVLGAIGSAASSIIAVVLQDGALETGLAGTVVVISVVGILYLVKREKKDG